MLVPSEKSWDCAEMLVPPERVGTALKCSSLQKKLLATQKSPHPVEARWLVSPFLGKEDHFSCVRCKVTEAFLLLETTPPGTSRSFLSSFLHTNFKQLFSVRFCQCFPA